MCEVKNRNPKEFQFENIYTSKINDDPFNDINLIIIDR